MTNLSPDRPAWRQQITRERLLVAAPGLLGLALAAGVFVAFGLPVLERIDRQRQRLVELEGKRDTIPLLEAQFVKSEQALAEVMQQQALLVDLVAGRGQIQTFLAQLSRISSASGVEISLYEPVPAVASEASVSGSNQDQQTQGDERPAASGDPLRTLGYEKSSVLLQVDGPYQGLLQFLRRMELLELQVQPSDLELTAVEAPDEAEDQPVNIGPPRTRLKLRLTFFDQAPKVDNASGRDEGTAGMRDGAQPPS